jgi:hypothetical protein
MTATLGTRGAPKPGCRQSVAGRGSELLGEAGLLEKSPQGAHHREPEGRAVP